MFGRERVKIGAGLARPSKPVTLGASTRPLFLGKTIFFAAPLIAHRTSLQLF